MSNYLVGCPFGCPRVLQYANPNVDFVTHPGVPSGTSTPDGSGRTRFNARTAALLSEYMVNYRGPQFLDRIFRGHFEALPDVGSGLPPP